MLRTLDRSTDENSSQRPAYKPMSFAPKGGLYCRQHERSLALTASRPSRTILTVTAPISRGDITGLCQRAQKLLAQTDEGPVLCDVHALLEPDAVALEALARLQLTARRLGREIRLLHASPELVDLLEFAGLCGVLPHCCEKSGLEPSGQAEEREQRGRVEEEAGADDLPT
jgi:hypothetical protein